MTPTAARAGIPAFRGLGAAMVLWSVLGASCSRDRSVADDDDDDGSPGEGDADTDGDADGDADTDGDADGDRFDDCRQDGCGDPFGVILCCDDALGSGQTGCTWTDRDVFNCGECGVVCEDPWCEGGVCRRCQDAGQVVCAGVDHCVDPDRDSDHCGDCQTRCPAGTACIDGVCTEGDCDDVCPFAGELCCDDPEGRGAGPGCADLGDDPFNCGACGVECGSGGSCLDGACLCVEELDDVAICHGVCTDIGRDPDNCGGCGVVCPAEARICRPGLGIAGSCTDCVEDGLADCGGSDCTRLSLDDDNCGACGHACAGDEMCVGGECRTGLCQPCRNESGEIWGLCCDEFGGSCSDLNFDPDNCGDCEVVCGEGRACEYGTCVEVGCRYPFADCGLGACVNLLSDSANCSACGDACPEDEQCVGGVCTPGPCDLDCRGPDGLSHSVCCPGAAGLGQDGCVDLGSDPYNCGACGAECGLDRFCAYGVCAGIAE